MKVLRVQINFQFFFYNFEALFRELVQFTLFKVLLIVS